MAKVKKEKKVSPNKKVRTANRLTRGDKISKRLKGVSAKTGFKAKSAMFTFRVIARQATDLHGFIVSEHSDSVLFRHKRTNASKRMVVTRFPHSEIIELFGAAGEPASLTTMRDVVIREMVGKLVEDKNGVVTIQTAGGETVKLFQNDNVRIEISVEDEAGEKSERGSKSGKTDKVKKKKSKKAAKADDEDDEDDLDD